MSDMYAIKDTTLTALGDAVRLKKDGLKVNPYVHKVEPLIYKSGTGTENLTFSTDEMDDLNGIKTSWIKVRVNSITNWQENGWSISYKSNSNLSGVKIPYGTTFPIEFYCALGWVSFYGYHTPSSDNPNLPLPVLDVEIWGCDENKEQYLYTPLEMVDAINGLMAVPDEAFTVTGNCNYAYSNNRHNWLLEGAGERMSLTNITYIGNICYGSDKLKFFPDIYMETNQTHVCTSAFYRCYSLERVPMIYGLKPTTSSIDRMFYECYRLRDFPEGFGSDWNYTALQGATYGGLTAMFYSCYSLRTLPDAVIRNGWNKSSSAYSNTYGQLFYYCASLDEINDLGVSEGSLPSNVFDKTFNYTMRLKNMTFAVNEDGTPKTANWKSQTVDLSGYVGYTNTLTRILDYNSGITADKEVIDDATYQALKDDPDWFTCDVNYSRYNHDSAVRTINSLPDCSATGTNTIKFSGASGALTDGGAINTLTEEEIAVATAKGWTVSLV